MQDLHRAGENTQEELRVTLSFETQAAPTTVSPSATWHLQPATVLSSPGRAYRGHLG